MKKIAQKKEKSNVLSISASPRFRETERSLEIVCTGRKTSGLTVYTMPRNAFGFVLGDVLICQSEFNPDEVKPKSLVLAREAKYNALTIAAAAENEIIALVTAFQREVNQK